MDDAFENDFSTPQFNGGYFTNDQQQYLDYAKGLSRDQLQQGQGGEQSIWWRPENSDGNYFPVSRQFVDTMNYLKSRGVNYYGNPSQAFDDGVYHQGEGDAFEQAQFQPQELPKGMQEPKFDMSNGGRGTPVKSEWAEEDPEAQAAGYHQWKGQYHPQGDNGAYQPEDGSPSSLLAQQQKRANDFQFVPNGMNSPFGPVKDFLSEGAQKAKKWIGKGVEGAENLGSSVGENLKGIGASLGHNLRGAFRPYDQEFPRQEFKKVFGQGQTAQATGNDYGQLLGGELADYATDESGLYDYNPFPHDPRLKYGSDPVTPHSWITNEDDRRMTTDPAKDAMALKRAEIEMRLIRLGQQMDRAQRVSNWGSGGYAGQVLQPGEEYEDLTPRDYNRRWRAR